MDVTLDPDTANPELILSADGKQVQFVATKQNYTENTKRFDTYLGVLGKNGLSSGRFYCEVQVSGKSSWTVGVVRKSITRKGNMERSPTKGFWVIQKTNVHEYVAKADPDVTLSLKERPETVGVFVDYDAGLITFYDAQQWNLIYSYRRAAFNETIYLCLNPHNNNNGPNSGPLIINNPGNCVK